MDSSKYPVDALNSILHIYTPQIKFKKLSVSYSKQADFSAYFGDNVVPKTFDKISEDFKVAASKTPFHFESITLCNSKLLLKLSRRYVFESVLSSILNQGSQYGFRDSVNQTIVFLCTKDDNDSLWNYRVALIQKVAYNMFKFLGFKVPDESEAEYFSENAKTISFCMRHVDQKESDKFILCNKVVDVHNETDTNISFNDYRSLRENDMRNILAQKYWDSANEETIKVLATSIIDVELLQTPPKLLVKLNLEKDVKSVRAYTTKGGQFILYNVARLKSIFKSYEIKKYPELPPLNKIDTSLLREDEEWLILFEYLLEYPRVLQDCLDGWENGVLSPNRLCKFLFQLCSIFSTYYRRIRILQEPKSHLIPLIFARMAFIKAVDQVMANALQILEIKSVEFM